MPQFKVIKAFKGSPDGCTVNAYAVGKIVSDDELGADLLAVAQGEKWIGAVKKADIKTDPKADAKGADTSSEQDPEKTPEQIAEAIAAEEARLAAAPDEEKTAIQTGIDKLRAWLTGGK